MERAFRGVLSILLMGTLLAVELRADEAADQYAVAAGHYSAERWQLASEEFATFLKDYATHEQVPHARFYLAESFVQLGRLAEARRLFEELLESDSKSPLARRAQFRKGEASFLAEDDASARRDLEAFLKQYPDDELNAFALPYLGELALRSGNAKEAIEHYQIATERFAKGPLAEECRFGVARAHEQLGELDEARVEYELLSKDAYAPLADKAQFQLGVLHNHAGRFGEALANFESFHQRFKDSQLTPQVDLAQGWSLCKLNRFAEAEGVFKSLVEIEEISGEARYWLGTVYTAQQRWQEALESFEAASKGDLSPRLQSAIVFQMGEVFRKQNDFDRAAKQFDLILEKESDDSYADDALFGRLQLAIQQNANEKAIQIAEDFVTRFAESQPDVAADCRATIAVCQARLGKLAEAKKTLAQLKALSPTSELIAPTTCKVAEAAFQAGDQATAKELFSELAADDKMPEWQRRGLTGLAWSQRKAEDLAGSAATFEKLLKDYPNDPLAASAALVHGQSLEKLGQLEPALAMYRRVMDEFPQSGEVLQATFRAALVHEKLHQFDDARGLYRRLSDVQPPFSERATVLYQWGCLEADNGQLDLANQLWHRVCDDHGQSSVCTDATYRLAAAALESRNLKDCQKLLAGLDIEKVPEQLKPHVLYLNGRLAAAQDDWKAVASPLERLFREMPDHALAVPAGYWLAEATYRQGNYPQAEEQFAKLLPRCSGPNDKFAPMVSLRRAQSLVQQGKWKEGLDLARQIETDHPQFHSQYEVDYLIGRCLANDADFAAAREAYTKVVRSETGGKTETAAMAQWMIGESYFHQEDFAAALRAYLRVEILYAYPKWQAAALVQAGKCQEELGEWRQAVETYSKLLKTYPNSEVAEEAAKRFGIAQQKLDKRRS